MHQRTAATRYDLLEQQWPDCRCSELRARLDAPADEVQQVVERMKQLAMQFVVRVNDSGLFEPVSGPMIYTCMFDKLDRNLALVTVELVLREIMGVCARNLTE